MADLLTTPLSRRLRLARQTPMPGESISSMVDRQAQLWGVLRWDLLDQAAFIDGWLARKDLDVCRKGDFLDIYAQKTGIERQELEAHRAEWPDPLIRSTWRHAYCPICFFEDASAGYTPYFRLDWARIFLTHCRKHACPLFQWPRVSQDGTRKLPHGWFVGEGPKAHALPQFEQDLILARTYACGACPKAIGSKEAWDTLRCFEAWLYDMDVGAPRHRKDDQFRSIERDVLCKTVELARFATTHGRLQTDMSDVPAFEEQRVMSFAFKTARVHTSNPAWRDLRSGLGSIARRRAVLVSVAKLGVAGIQGG